MWCCGITDPNIRKAETREGYLASQGYMVKPCPQKQSKEFATSVSLFLAIFPVVPYFLFGVLCHSPQS